MAKFPVNLASGALMAVVGGLAMRLWGVPADKIFGGVLVLFFFLGILLAAMFKKPE